MYECAKGSLRTYEPHLYLVYVVYSHDIQLCLSLYSHRCGVSCDNIGLVWLTRVCLGLPDFESRITFCQCVC